MEALNERVNTLVTDQLGVDRKSLTPEANLLDDLGADSLDVVELVMALEEEFGIEVPDDDVENIRTISDIVQYIEARAQA
ncbi:MAG: acyl carrier protein [Myxococcota bacterium]